MKNRFLQDTQNSVVLSRPSLARAAAFALLASGLSTGLVAAAPAAAENSAPTPATTATSSPATSNRVQKLSNGMTLVTRFDQTSPRVAISLLVRVGASDETAATAGWRRVLTESMLRASYSDLPIPAATSGTTTSNTTTPDAKTPAENAPDADKSTTGNAAPGLSGTVLTGAQLQRLALAAGGRIGASVGDDVLEFWVTGESRNAPILLDLLMTLVTRPRLANADINAGRRRIRANVQNEADDIALMATSSLRAQIYRDAAGKPLAYGLPPQGTDESLRRLTAGKIRALYQAYFNPQNFTVAATGDVDATALSAKLEKVSMPARRDVPTVEPTADVLPEEAIVVRPAPPVFSSPSRTEPILLVRQLPTQDAWIFISYRTAAANGTDAPALSVLAAALGESPTARLPRRLLNGRLPSIGGLPDETALQASVSLTPRRFGSEFVIYAQTGVSNVDSVKNALLD
ncbi:MAG TPA: insulinase family protein, partial [Abditibacteriaceae bacterium]